MSVKGSRLLSPCSPLNAATPPILTHRLCLVIGLETLGKTVHQTVTSRLCHMATWNGAELRFPVPKYHDMLSGSLLDSFNILQTSRVWQGHEATCLSETRVGVANGAAHFNTQPFECAA